MLPRRGTMGCIDVRSQHFRSRVAVKLRVIRQGRKEPEKTYNDVPL